MIVCRQRETTKALKRFVATPMSGTIYIKRYLYMPLQILLIKSIPGSVMTYSAAEAKNRKMFSTSFWCARRIRSTSGSDPVARTERRAASSGLIQAWFLHTK